MGKKETSSYFSLILPFLTDTELVIKIKGITTKINIAVVLDAFGDRHSRGLTRFKINLFSSHQSTTCRFFDNFLCYHSSQKYLWETSGREQKIFDESQTCGRRRWRAMEK